MTERAGNLRTLVISPNWIGDAVMAQPLLQLLRAQHPDRAIDVLAPPSVAPVWRQMAEVADVLEAPFRHGALQLKERWQYARQLRRRGYADAYVLPNTLKFALLPWLAGIPTRVGYRGESRYGLINVMHENDVPQRPMVPFYAALAQPPVRPLPAGFAPPRPRLQADDEQVRLAFARSGLDLERPLLAFAPGAEFGSAKRWPAEHFAGLAQLILARHRDAQIVLLGSPKDREVCKQLADAVGPAGDGAVFNLAGQTSLAEAVALIARAAAVVSNDSGLMHIASAQDRPVVVMYGPTDFRQTPPSSPVAAMLSLELDCAPCHQRECPLEHHRCMRDMTPAFVWRTLEPMLETSLAASAAASAAERAVQLPA